MALNIHFFRNLIKIQKFVECILNVRTEGIIKSKKTISRFTRFLDILLYVPFLNVLKSSVNDFPGL